MPKPTDQSKVHTTNYFDTFLGVAEDTKAVCGTPPPSREGKKTIAEMQYDLLAGHPYRYTSDDVLFQIYADRHDLTKEEYALAREKFFSKGQACLRASPLPKTYGYGIHYNEQGKMALYGMETAQYEQFAKDKKIKKIQAMRSSRKKS